MEPLLNLKDAFLCIASWPDETLRGTHAVKYATQEAVGAGKKKGEKRRK
jgi:hypothetical protein